MFLDGDFNLVSPLSGLDLRRESDLWRLLVERLDLDLDLAMFAWIVDGDVVVFGMCLPDSIPSKRCEA